MRFNSAARLTAAAMQYVRAGSDIARTPLAHTGRVALFLVVHTLFKRAERLLPNAREMRHHSDPQISTELFFLHELKRFVSCDGNAISVTPLRIVIP